MILTATGVFCQVDCQTTPKVPSPRARSITSSSSTHRRCGDVARMRSFCSKKGFWESVISSTAHCAGESFGTCKVHIFFWAPLSFLCRKRWHLTRDPIMNSTEWNPAAGADMNLGIAKCHLIHRANLALGLHLLKLMVEYRIQERLILDGDCPIIAHSVPNRRHTRSSQQALATCFCVCVCVCVSHVSAHVCVCAHVHAWARCEHACEDVVRLSVCLSVRPSVCLSVCSAWLAACLSVCLSVCSAWLAGCLAGWLAWLAG